MDAVHSVYGMQRANGDWFALERREGFRVPIFSSISEAMQARMCNVEMLLFHPALVAEKALAELGSPEGQPAAHFWLVKQGSTNLKRGVSLQFAELAALVRRYEMNGSPQGNLEP